MKVLKEDNNRGRKDLQKHRNAEVAQSVEHSPKALFGPRNGNIAVKTG